MAVGVNKVGVTGLTSPVILDSTCETQKKLSILCGSSISDSLITVCSKGQTSFLLTFTFTEDKSFKILGLHS